MSSAAPGTRRATLQSAAIALPAADGRELRLHRIAEPPCSRQKRLLHQLHVTLPERFELDREGSENSAPRLNTQTTYLAIGPCRDELRLESTVACASGSALTRIQFKQSRVLSSGVLQSLRVASRLEMHFGAPGVICYHRRISMLAS